jgi:hypothetical protein
MLRLISFDYWTIIRFILDTKATTAPVFFFNRWPRADLGRQQICGSADEVRSL